MNNKIIPLTGYLIFVITYVYQLFLNITHDASHYPLIGSFVILFGYFLLANEYYSEIKEDDDIAMKSKKAFLGHLVLVLYHTASFIFPINPHVRLTDLTSLFGHILIIKKTEYSNYGYMLLTTYYLLYTTRLFRHHGNINMLQFIAAILLSYFYGKASVSFINEKLSKKKIENDKKEH